jgi:hypothetical protein
MATHPELLNPPPDVQEAVAGVIKACGMWEPTQVENLPPHLPAAGQTAPGLSEAQICGFIQHPDALVWSGVNIVLMIATLFAAFVWAFRLHRLPGALWCVTRRLWGAA